MEYVRNVFCSFYGDKKQNYEVGPFSLDTK